VFKIVSALLVLLASIATSAYCAVSIELAERNANDARCRNRADDEIRHAELIRNLVLESVCNMMASTHETATGNFPAHATIKIGILSMADEHDALSASSKAHTTEHAAAPMSELLCKTHSVIRDGKTSGLRRTTAMALDDSRSFEHE
jgi:hypothetical protein